MAQGPAVARLSGGPAHRLRSYASAGARAGYRRVESPGRVLVGLVLEKRANVRVGVEADIAQEPADEVVRDHARSLAELDRGSYGVAPVLLHVVPEGAER